MFFFGLSAYENFLGIDIKTISETLEITERSVITALNELEGEKIIIKMKHGIDKRRNDYFINPLAAWKGNSYSRDKRIKTLVQNKQQLELFPKNL
jgi:DNA-binding transcriptional regulator GbsR (MarR family)